MRKGTLLLATTLLFGAATLADAQDQSCIYEGERYAEGTTVCQAGLRQTCMNGTWQSLDGERCGADEDQQIEQEGGLNPQGGFSD